MKIGSIGNEYGYADLFIFFEGEYIPLKCYNHGYAIIDGHRCPWWNVYIDQEDE